MKEFRLALVVGHSYLKGGAKNKSYGINEFFYNSHFVAEMDEALKEIPINFKYKIFHRPGLNSNRASLKELSKQINQWRADWAIEWHCNASEKKSIDGHLVKVWHSTGARHRRLAAEVVRIFGQVFKNQTMNGAGVVSTHWGERGWPLMAWCICPVLIAEPFFISNSKALRRNTQDHLIKANAMAVVLGLKSIIETYFTGSIKQ